MKKNKIFFTILLLITILSVTACSDENTGSSNNQTSTTDVNVDYDLTEMSSTMVFSQINDLMMNGDKYVGKTFRIIGQYQSQFNQATGITYSFVVVSDATGCCPQGIEFICTTEVEMPDVLTLIELIGTFESYYEGEMKYYRLSTEDIVLK